MSGKDYLGDVIHAVQQELPGEDMNTDALVDTAAHVAETDPYPDLHYARSTDDVVEDYLNRS
jgi:hypothetical protein